MGTKNNNPLPEFLTPPIVEVVIGVSFKRLKLLLPHYGIYWSSLQPDFPKVLEAPPIQRVLERFPDDDNPPIIDLEVTTRPILPRQLFASADDSHLIQIQEDRFILNWRRVSEEEEYPRFSNVFKQFESRLEEFKSFLEKIGQRLEPVQYELTYLNHLEGFGLQKIETVIPSVRAVIPDATILKQTESMDFHLTFRLPNRQGRLHATVKSGEHIKGDFINLEFTARSAPIIEDDSSMKDWFEIAREWIVRGFCDLTDSNVQSERWKRKL